MEVTAKVLTELKTENIPRMTVFNKIDLVDENVLTRLKANYPKSVFISVHEKSGIDELKERISDHFTKHKEKHQFQYEKAPGKKW